MPTSSAGSPYGTSLPSPQASAEPMPPKRKLPSLGLERRVRARREDEWEPGPAPDEAAASDDSSSEEADADDDDDGDGASAASDAESETGSESPESSDVDAGTPKVDLSSVSFGALARAQASLPPTGRRAKKAESRDAATAEDAERTAAESRPARRPKAAEANKAKVKRASKHAPQEQSSKKPVSRRREILADPRRKHRDPRFDPLVGRLDEAKASKAYAFLDEYRDGEMAELRAQMRKTRDADAKERLKRQLMSMESKRKARRRKDEEDELLRQHRREEKELVAQGKKPFYLKRSEQKKQLLTKRYESMSKGQVDRAIERKRKKVAGKEKKELGSLLRVRDRR
ncbi:hypothetical protein CDD83_6617 [Cordyceps sp. RAO-2017]|nr:hypothetical protein CDD83_6617 [Cordyceps sp. RAO-2017]